jgi:hypothetical protein
MVMLVIAGAVRPRTWVLCPECDEVGFTIDDEPAAGRRLEVVEGGLKEGCG